MPLWPLYAVVAGATLGALASLCREETTLRQWWCRIRYGHTGGMRITDGQMSSRCDTCGWESPSVSTAAEGR